MTRRAALRKAVAKKRMKGPWQPIRQMDLDAMNKDQATKRPSWCTRLFSNNKVVVQVADEAATDQGTAIRAMVQAWDNTPISWATLQKVKNEVFGPEAWAVQYFPAQHELIDEFNFYWLWVFPGGQLPLPINGGAGN